MRDAWGGPARPAQVPLCCSGAGEGDATTPKPGDLLLGAPTDAVRDAALPSALAQRGSLGQPGRAPGMLAGAGEGARERGPHPRRSSPGTGDCGPPPRMTHSRPSSDEHPSSFPVGSRVTYACVEGTIKIPGRSDTVECLPGPRWSKLPEPCGRKHLLPLKHGSLARFKVSAAYGGCSATAPRIPASCGPAALGCWPSVPGPCPPSGGRAVAAAWDAHASPEHTRATSCSPLTALPGRFVHLRPRFARDAFSRAAAWYADRNNWSSPEAP